MARHGRQVKREQRDLDETRFDDRLNSCIELLEKAHPDEWNFILSYIDTEACIPSHLFNNKVITDNQLAREAYKRQGKAEILARLARFKQRGVDENIVS